MKDNSKTGYLELYRFATKKESVALYFAVITAAIAGAAIPISTVLLGSLVDAFSNWQMNIITTDFFLARVNFVVLFFVYLASKNI